LDFGHKSLGIPDGEWTSSLGMEKKGRLVFPFTSTSGLWLSAGIVVDDDDDG